MYCKQGKGGLFLPRGLTCWLFSRLFGRMRSWMTVGSTCGTFGRLTRRTTRWNSGRTCTRLSCWLPM